MSLDNTVSLLVSILSPLQKQREVAAELMDSTGEALDINDLGIVTTSPSSTALSVESNASSTPTPTAAPAVTVTASSSSSSGLKVGINTAVIAVCMLRLLQLPVRLNSPSARALVLPETFCFDGQRLSLLRDLVDILSVQVLRLICFYWRLIIFSLVRSFYTLLDPISTSSLTHAQHNTLQCTVMITIRQALQKVGLLSSEAEETTLYQRLNVLLRDSSVGMKDIVAEAVRFVRVAKEASRGELDAQYEGDRGRLGGLMKQIRDRGRGEEGHEEFC